MVIADRMSLFRLMLAASAHGSAVRNEFAAYFDTLEDDYARGLADALRERTYRRLPVRMGSVN